jgi:hypothetical protein
MHSLLLSLREAAQKAVEAEDLLQSYNGAVHLGFVGGGMHPQYRPALHSLWIVLLVAALVVLFPISARSNLDLAAIASAL